YEHMQTPQISRNLRMVFMSITIAAVTAFGIYGAGWTTPAGAQGTVPGGGGGGGGSNNNGNSTNSNTTNNPGGYDPSVSAEALCGTGPQSFSIQAPNDVTGLLKLGVVGTVRLNSNTGGVGNGAVRILFVPVTSFTAKLI